VNRTPVSDAAVRELFARGLIVPTPGNPWSNPGAFYLSAAGWRAMGCIYTDRTAEVEARVYELAGTERDNDRARMYRSVTAEWRARQARQATNPTWDKWCEWFLTIPDRVTGDGVKTVTVLFESGRPSGADHFEFFGAAVNEKGYYQHAQARCSTLGRTVIERAGEIVFPVCAAYAEEQRIAKSRRAARLRVIDDDDDPEALARELGLLP
jgi:hypothetical protein